MAPKERTDAELEEIIRSRFEMGMGAGGAGEVERGAQGIVMMAATELLRRQAKQQGVASFDPHVVIKRVLDSSHVAEGAGTGSEASMEKKDMASAPDKRSVFIIHGRNVAARDAVEHFLRALDLVPVDFDQLAADMGTEFVGNIVLEGLKRAHGIVALFTPDEYAGLLTTFRAGSSGTEILRWQSRPNVLFEAGIAFGTARSRTVLVTLGEDVSLFSDVSGIHILRLSNNLESRKKFRQKLIGVGCAVDQRADSYTDPARSGDFEAPIAGLAGVSPLDPFRSKPQ